MFTGIVTEAGEVRKRRLRRGVLDLEIHCPRIARELDPGDSVAVNGVCLTAVGRDRRHFEVQVMEETVTRSTLGGLEKGDRVNLELPVRMSDRLGGHLVQGHVDGVASVARVERSEGIHRIWLAASEDLLRYLVPKGSVALDGVSLTVVDVGRTTFQVALIPYTLSSTTLGGLREDTKVNVEVDVIAKYVEGLIGARERDRHVTG